MKTVLMSPIQVHLQCHLQSSRCPCQTNLFIFKSEADFKLPQRRCDAELDKVNNIANATATDLIAS